MKWWKRGFKMLLAFVMVGTMISQVYATSMEDAQQDKETAEENKSKAEQILGELEAKKSDIQEYVYELDTQVADIQSQIQDLNNQKADLETQIAATQEALAVAKEEEQKQYADMCARIQFMYENGDTNYADTLLSVKSMSDVLNETEYVSAMATYDTNMLEELVQTREQIANDEQLLEMNLASVEQLTGQLQEEEKAVNELLEAKSAEMAEYDGLIDEQEKLVQQYDAEIQAAASRIAEIEAAAAAATQSGEQITTNTGTNYQPYSGGMLTWPCPSSYKINSGFGRRDAYGVVTANHYGVDIGCPDGTPIVSAASGVVVLARYSGTAGNWIIISHGNGVYTIYMHASAIYVSEGQYVNAGDTIMLSGATGMTEGRHLHFEVRVGGYSSSRYSVDPMGYF